MESERSVKFSYSVTLTHCSLSTLWMDLFTCFVTFCIWSSGMYWFTKLCSSSKCWHISLYNIQKKKKSHSLLPPSSSRSLFRRKLSNPEWQVQVLQNSDFCLKVKFHHWQQVLSADRQLCTFSRKCLPNRRACKAVVWSVSHYLEWKWCSMKHVASAAHSHMAFFRALPGVFPILSHGVFKRCVLKSWDF